MVCWSSVLQAVTPCQSQLQIDRWDSVRSEAMMTHVQRLARGMQGRSRRAAHSSRGSTRPAYKPGKANQQSSQSNFQQIMLY